MALKSRLFYRHILAPKIKTQQPTNSGDITEKQHSAGNKKPVQAPVFLHTGYNFRLEVYAEA
ncbi:MAG: hypothetical protein ACRC38_05880, partial [Plesiomonas sp.]